MRHVVQISFFSDAHEREPAELLEAWPTLVDVAEAAVKGGVRVSVVQASCCEQSLVRNGVEYHFFPFGEARSDGDANDRLHELLQRLEPDIFHVHGLGFHRHTLALERLAPTVPIILQDHASRPPRMWRRGTWRRGLSVASAVCFCSLDQARPFVAAGLIEPATQLFAIPESTSRFAPGDRADARTRTGVTGEPALLWVGHLDTNKDPLAILSGVSAAVADLPRVQLYGCFGNSPLLAAVRARIDADSNLRNRVHLLGRVPHDRIESLMQAADLFVAGSHREGSGYSLIEAIACGLTPVVTDIPSFRALTGNGAVGALWPCGNSQELTNALRSVWARTDSNARAQVRAHFDRELSFSAVGRKLAAMYEETIGRRAALQVRISSKRNTAKSA